MKLNKLLYIFCFALLLSCKTKQTGESQLNYIQNIEEVARNTALQRSRSTIQSGDELVILVSAKDMDVVKPFNQNYSSYQNTTTSALGRLSESQAKMQGPSYFVDSQGYINFPEIGLMDTKGKTLEDLKLELQDQISNYVLNPIVNIRLANFVVTILGEVNKQGDFTIPNGQATIFNALGLTGGLTIHAERDKVLMIRTEDGQITENTINLKDANFINSPYYYLKQGDVLVVPSNEIKETIAKQNPNTGTILTAISLGVSALAIGLSVLLRN